MQTTEYNYISAEPLDLAYALERHNDKRAGALVFFSGQARNHHNGKEVIKLEYEAQNELAAQSIAEILADAKEKYNLYYAFCQHRIGTVELEESSVLVVTLGAHRPEAYKGNRYIIDRVKHESPIWKREYYSDGTSHWGENCDHDHDDAEFKPESHTHKDGHKHH